MKKQESIAEKIATKRTCNIAPKERCNALDNRCEFVGINLFNDRTKNRLERNGGINQLFFVVVGGK